MHENKDLYESIPVGRALIRLMVPTVISQIITVIYNMADTFFIGRLNNKDLVAAATLSLPLFMFLTALANLFGIGGSAVISRCLGRGDNGRAMRASAFSVWAAAAAAVVYGAVLYVIGPRLLPLLGTDADTYAPTRSYLLWVITIGGIPTVLNAVFAHLVRSEGYSGRASFGMGLGGVLNILLDPLFIYTFDLGIAGAAIATAVSNLAGCIYFVIFLHSIRQKSVIRPLPRYFTFSDHIASETLVSGLPGAIMTVMGTLSNAVLNHLAAGYTNYAVAGLGIAKKVDSLAYAISLGMTQGTISLIAYNYASGNKARMHESIRKALLATMAIALIILITLELGAGVITRAFIDDSGTVSYGRMFLRINAVAAPTTAANYMIVTVFQAAREKKKSLFLSLLRKGSLDIPLMIGLNALIGVKGILWATPIADFTALVISLALFLPFYKKLDE